MLVSAADKLARIRDLCEQGITIDGGDHKQWHLVQIAEIVGVDITIEDEGVAP